MMVLSKMGNNTGKDSKISLHRVLFSDGKKIYGNWIDGLQHGFGYYELPEGKKIRGVWNKGQFDPKSGHIGIGDYEY